MEMDGWKRLGSRKVDGGRNGDGVEREIGHGAL